MGLRSVRGFFVVRGRHAALFALQPLFSRKREHRAKVTQKQARRFEPKMTEARTKESTHPHHSRSAEPRPVGRRPPSEST
eukprot:110544-Amphidinium_carterae.1